MTNDESQMTKEFRGAVLGHVLTFRLLSLKHSFVI